jgi:DNA-binding response OmpR family regulator
MQGNLLIVEQHHEHGEKIHQDIFNLFDKYYIAMSENEANILLIEEEFDMIIVNPFFEDGSGRSFIRSLRKNTKLYNTPIIVVSTLPAKQAKIDFYSYGADVYFEMPYDKEEFHSTIENKLKRHFNAVSNKGQDDVTGLGPREKFEQDYKKDQENIKLQGERGILGLVAPDGIDSVIKKHGLETGDMLLKETARLIKEMCCEDLQAVSWTHRSIVFAIMEKSGEAVRNGLEMLRKQFLENMKVITKNPNTPGFHAVLNPIDTQLSLEESLEIMTNQLIHISQNPNEEPIQFMQDKVPSKRYILVADPDQVACSLAKHRIEKDGFIPICFSKIQEIFSQTSPEDIAAMLIDTMVLGGGIKMLEEIKKDPRLVDIPIMIISRFGHEHEIVESFKVGAADYLMKPFSIPELSSRLKRLAN